MTIIKILLLITNLFFFQICLNAKTIDIENNNRLTFDDIDKLTSFDLYSDNLTKDDLNLIIKDLVSSELITDIELSVNVDSFTIKVLESLFINEIFINGNIKLKNSDIINNLQIKNKSFIDENKIIYNSLIIENLYTSIGQQQVVVSYYLEKFNDSSFNLIYEVKENIENYLTDISINGNRFLSTKFIKSNITIKEKKFFTPLSFTNFITENKINNNLSNITKIYKNNGFIDISINYEIKKIKNKLFLKIYINEGMQYKINQIVILTDNKNINNLFLNDKNLSIQNLKNKFYNANVVNSISDEFNKELLINNYPNITIDHSIELADNNSLNLNFFATEYLPQTINKINFYGNNVTKDITLRKHIFIKPGELVNERVINKSISNLIRKPYIDNVIANKNLNTDQSIDLDFILSEKEKSGNFKLGASYSAQSGAATSVGISDSNLYGTGNKLSGDLSVSSETVFFDISLSRYFLGNYSVNNTYRVFNNDENLTNTYGYKRKSSGLDFAIKIPYKYDISKDEYFVFALGYENSDIYSLSNSVSNSVEQNSGVSSNVYLKSSYTNNTMNDDFNPTSGRFHETILSLSPTGFSDDDYIKISTINNFYFNRVGSDSSFFVRSNLGIASGLSKKIKTKDSFALGSNFKGFQYSGIGPRDDLLNYLGGTKMYQLTIGYSNPFLFDNTDTFILKYFATAGSIFDSEYKSKHNSKMLRASIGTSVDIMTPIGPLSFSLASPISKHSKDKTQTYDFSIGSTF